MVERLPEKLKRMAYSLIFFVFCWGGAYAMGNLIDAGDWIELVVELICIWSVFFIFFLVAFGFVFANAGERTGRALFIQGGGIFTVIFSIIALLNSAAPNPEHWHDSHGWRYMLDFAGFCYFWIIPLPLILAVLIGANLYYKEQ